MGVHAAAKVACSLILFPDEEEEAFFHHFVIVIVLGDLVGLAGAKKGEQAKCRASNVIRLPAIVKIAVQLPTAIRRLILLQPAKATNHRRLRFLASSPFA